MKMHIVTDEGTLIDSINNLEDFDFDRPLAKGGLMLDIVQIIEQGRDIELEEQLNKEKN